MLKLIHTINLHQYEFEYIVSNLKEALLIRNALSDVENKLGDKVVSCNSFDLLIFNREFDEWDIFYDENYYELHDYDLDDNNNVILKP